MRSHRSPGHAAIALLWAFRVWADFGTEPVENGWVATATRASCDAAQRAFLDVARAYGTTVDLGDCREITPDDLRRPASAAPLPDSPAVPDYYGVRRGIPSRGSRSTLP
jgi:hypothetical protein